LFLLVDSRASCVVRAPMSDPDPSPDLDADANPDWLDDAELVMDIVVGSTTCQTRSSCRTVLTLKDHIA
jgi:hypothetical protein